jgi:hypothetical protein
MGVYSVMLPDEKLIKAIRGFKQIVILGCEGCANDSISYFNNSPQKAVFDTHMKRYHPAPDAVLQEAMRLKSLFVNDCNDIRVTSAMGLCMKSTSEPDEEWVATCKDAQSVLVLSCPAGVMGAKTALTKGIKIIAGMKTVGVLYSYRDFHSDTGLLHVDKQKSASVILFK